MTTSIKQKAYKILFGALLIAAVIAPSYWGSSAQASSHEKHTNTGVIIHLDPTTLPTVIAHPMGNWGG